MANHDIASREEWLAARLDLLEAEKAYTREGDALAARRQALPWVPVTKPYRFETEEGERSLADLFGGRSQLMIYHFMFGPDFEAGCPSCSAIADGFNGIVTHLQNHDVAFSAVSRAPLDKLMAFRARMGWSFPWASSFATDFNQDYAVSFTDEHIDDGHISYNFERQRLPEWRRGESAGDGAEQNFADQSGTDARSYSREKPGISSFVIEDGQVYHCYSAYSRGVDAIWSMYPWLDRAPKGRNESGVWWRHHDRYGV